MTGKQLKNSILQWAIQGKLVPQDPNDEPASVLLEKIRQEKERLIKEKKIKRDKNASIIYRGEDNSYYEKFLATGEVKCIDEEIPFEIPQSWCWVRLGAIATIIGGYAFPSESIKSEKGYRVIRISDFNDSKIVYNKVVRYNGDADLTQYEICERDILMAMTGGTVGKSVFLTELPEKHMLLNQRVAIIRNKYIFDEYLNLVITSPITIDVVNSRKNSTNDNISMVDICNFLIPVPPTNEQKKIVQKIQEALPFVYTYGKSQEALDKLNEEIFDKLRKSVLQEAIQGKLVPQIAEEGTAQELLEQIKTEKQKLVKEGKLKKSALSDSVIYKGDDNKYYEQVGKQSIDITEEIPFEIPSSWQWVRLEHICSYIQRGKSPKYSPIKQYPVVAQKCNQWTGFTIEKAQFIDPTTIESYTQERFLEDGDLMWNSTGLGTLGRMAIYWEKLNPYKVAVADSHVTVIRPLKSFVIPQYLFSYFSSYTVQSVIEDKADGSTKQKELATTTVKRYLVPFPPLAEQKRIVEKIKEVTSIMRI